MRIIRALVYLAYLGASAVVFYAQEAPKLTEVQTLQVQIALERIEKAQLRMQLAQAEFETARAATQVLIKSLQVDGYTLNIESAEKMGYVKVEDKK